MRAGIVHTVRASKEVILSAGAIGSPQILMLSGIGPREHLEELEIPVLKNLRVGHNLHDHVSLGGFTFLVNQPVAVNPPYILNPENLVDYFANGDGPFTIPGAAEGLKNDLYY